MVDRRRFQSLGAAQLYDLSPKVILVLTFGDADKYQSHCALNRT